MLLSEFIANQNVKKELSECMENNSLPHTIIIEGENGTGKKTLANIIAEYCVCSSDGSSPCGICSDCIKANKNIHPDIFIADGNNSGELSIDSIRSIRSSAYIKPNEAPAKVYILLNCENMLIPAQNAFLKVLEEPPENVFFIMTLPSASLLLNTVRSRARIFSLYPVPVKDAETELRKRFPEKNNEEILNAATVCAGNIGMAILMLNSGVNEASELAESIYSSITLSNEYMLLTLTSRLAKNRTFAVNVIDRLIELSAEAVKASVGAETFSSAAENAAKRFSRTRLMRIQNTAQKARDILNINVNTNFFCTWLCAALRS